jgi:hypothetical protein
MALRSETLPPPMAAPMTAAGRRWPPDLRRDIRVDDRAPAPIAPPQIQLNEKISIMNYP